ncbi:MAG: transcription termination/antitermination protein NusG [Christensenellaceae bacterium]|jgi:transcriptional antiterminator NusG|nr:transcription termination/antitermination protein NusG [Christensenellaceae bacterium]
MAEQSKELRWYAVHTYATLEYNAARHLQQMIENNNLQDRIVEVKIPEQDKTTQKNGKTKQIKEKKFPGYIFIKMIYDDEVWYLVTQTQSITHFVGPDGHAIPLTQDEIFRLELEKKEEDYSIVKGESVLITEGALRNFEGTVEDVHPDKNKLKVSVLMFGARNTVELEYTQVVKLNK